MPHLWHDLELPTDGELTEIPAVVEIPRGGKVKYELDLELGVLRVDRILYSSMHYPTNYGFVPRTLGADGDPLDVLVLGQQPIAPLSVLRARVIGGFQMSDEAGLDHKILAIDVDDPAFASHRAAATLPKHLEEEIRHFFEDYKELEGKPSAVGAPMSVAEAVATVRDCAQRYRAIFAGRASSSPCVALRTPLVQTMHREPNMNAQDIMTRDVVTVRTSDTLMTAVDLLERASVRHLPVVDESNALVGMLSDRDLRDHRAYDLNLDRIRQFSSMRVKDVMKPEPVTVEPTTEARLIVGELLAAKVGALPVVKKGTRKILGIVSYVDLLRSLQ